MVNFANLTSFAGKAMNVANQTLAHVNTAQNVLAQVQAHVDTHLQGTALHKDISRALQQTQQSLTKVQVGTLSAQNLVHGLATTAIKHGGSRKRKRTTRKVNRLRKSRPRKRSSTVKIRIVRSKRR